MKTNLLPVEIVETICNHESKWRFQRDSSTIIEIALVFYSPQCWWRFQWVFFSSSFSYFFNPHHHVGASQREETAPGVYSDTKEASGGHALKHQPWLHSGGVIPESWRLTLTFSPVAFLPKTLTQFCQLKFPLYPDRLPCSCQLSPAALHVTEPASLSSRLLWEATV